MDDNQSRECSLKTVQWHVYLIRAENQALYCGITTDIQRRFQKHQSGKGARFFHSSPAQALVYVERCTDKSAALRRELMIKKLSKAAKEQLVKSYAEQCTASKVGI